MTNYELEYIPKGRVTPIHLPFTAKNIQEARAYAWSQIELVNTYKGASKGRRRQWKVKLPDNAKVIAINVLDRFGEYVKNSGAVAYDGKNLQWLVHKDGKITAYDMRGDGKILKTIKNPMAKKDYTKYTQQGMRIYKIWYSPLTESYDVLARKSDGEWAYGRDYNLKTGIWQGGRYSMNLNQLYERVGGTFGRVYKDNHRGPTGKF